MKNPFIIGREAPPELEEMWFNFTWAEAPPYLDPLDWLTYGSRGNLIDDKETSERLFEAYKQFLAEFKPEKFKQLFNPKT